MFFKTIEVGALGVNCSIVACEDTKEAIIIDSGDGVRQIASIVEANKLNVIRLVSTHGHFDHIGANKQVVSNFNCGYSIHADDTYLLSQVENSARMYGLQGENSPMPDLILTDGMEILFGKHKIKILHTPGHTPGGCCLYLENEKVLFAGDTLFYESIGRTDFPRGNHDDLINSVQTRLFTLPDEITVYPGHGPTTTIGHEKKYNPFF